MVIEQGRIIDGKYELLSPLGSGGQGSVYKAQHLQLGRLVAIKILNQGGDSLEVRFKREAEILHSMRHRNLALFYGFGEVLGAPYMALEYVEGVSLQTELENLRAAAGVIRSIEISKQIAAGMACVHSHGIVHRDLKPGNILLTKASDGTDLVKLIDFGLAALLPESVFSSAQNLTQAGHAVGTVYYMSPEQCFGQKVDARSDIYALGCVMWELLTGHPPFEGDNDFDIMRRHTEEALPALVADLGLSAPTAMELQKILQTCLAKDPAQRYSSMNELLSALEQFSLSLSDELGSDKYCRKKDQAANACPGTGSTSTEGRPLRKVFAGKGWLWICIAGIAFPCTVAVAVQTPKGSAMLAEMALFMRPNNVPMTEEFLRWCLNETKQDAAAHKNLLMRLYEITKVSNSPVALRFEITSVLDKCMLTATEKKKLYSEMAPALAYNTNQTTDNADLEKALLRQIEFLEGHSADKKLLADTASHLFDVYQDMSDTQRAAAWLAKVERYSTAEAAVAKIRNHNSKAWLCETAHQHKEAVTHRKLALKLIPKISNLDDEATMCLRKLMNGCSDNLTGEERLSIQPSLQVALKHVRSFSEPLGQRRWMLYSLLQSKMLRLMNRPMEAATILEKPIPPNDSPNPIVTPETNEYRAELTRLTGDLDARDHFGRTDALFTRSDVPLELSFPLKSDYAVLQLSKHHFVEAEKAQKEVLKAWTPALYPHTTAAVTNLFTHVRKLYKADPLPGYTLCADATAHRLLSSEEGRTHTIAKIGLDLFGKPMSAASIAACMKEREYGYSECQIAGHLAVQNVLRAPGSVENQIEQLYRILYKRAPTATERQDGVDRLWSGISLSSIAEKLVKALEYKQRWVFGFYRHYAHDHPSKKEAAFWFNQTNHENMAATGAAFAVSCESYSNLKWDKRKLMERLYMEVLGRVPSATEVTRAIQECDANEAVVKASD